MSDPYVNPKCMELAQHMFPEATREQQAECASDIQDAVDGFREWLNREPPEPDGECFRGGEYAAALAADLDRIQRELKR